MRDLLFVVKTYLNSKIIENRYENGECDTNPNSYGMIHIDVSIESMYRVFEDLLNHHS